MVGKKIYDTAGKVSKRIISVALID